MTMDDEERDGDLILLRVIDDQITTKTRFLFFGLFRAVAVGFGYGCFVLGRN